MQGGKAYDEVKAYLGTSKAVTLPATGLNDRLLQQPDRFRDDRVVATDLQGADSGLGTTVAAIIKVAANVGTVFCGFSSAVGDLLNSDRTAADSGMLIGETLRAANADAIAHRESRIANRASRIAHRESRIANTLNTTAKANQLLATDFVNLKAG